MSLCMNLNLRRSPPTPTAAGDSPTSEATPRDGDPVLVEIGSPYDLKHDVHVHYNFQEARFEGMPANFAEYFMANNRKKEFGQRLKRCRTGSSSSTTTATGAQSPTDPVQMLNQHFQLPFRQVPRVHVSGYEDRIPAVLVMLQHHFVARQGYLLPHIFRESPNKQDRDCAMRDIDRGTFCGDDHDVRVLADLIKLWFRELPQPILHEIPGDQLERLSQSTQSVTQALDQMLGSLERGVVFWLVDLLVRVAQYQEQNHMGLDQLAIILAPNLVRIETENPLVAVTLSKAVVDVLRRLLHERAALRTEAEPFPSSSQ